MDKNDKKCVVIQNGQRVTGLIEKQEAETEANRRNKLVESASKAGQPVAENAKASVKVNLFG